MPVQLINRKNNVHTNQSSLQKMFVTVDGVIWDLLNGSWFYSFVEILLCENCFMSLFIFCFGRLAVFFCCCFCFLLLLYFSLSGNAVFFYLGLLKKIIPFLPVKVLSLWQGLMKLKLRQTQSRRANNTRNVLSTS